MDIFEFIITAYFLWSLLTICSTLLLIQLEMVRFWYNSNGHFLFIEILSHFIAQSQENVNHFVLIRPITLAFWSFVNILFFCEFGKMVTGNFQDLDDIIFQWDWNSFPIEVQRMLPTILISTQKPIVLCGIANIVCDRESFKKVRILATITICVSTQAILLNIFSDL